MFGRQRHERRTEQRVGARRVDFELAAVCPGRIGQLECETRAAALADPVRLHQAHLLGPAVERVETAQQLVGEGRDLEVPLRQLAALDGGAGAPALAVDHLLVGQHGVVDGIPVDPGFAAIGEAGLPEIEEHLLLVPVVARIAGGELAAPVERQAHRLELRLHRGDVGVGPGLGMDLLLDRGILGRQAEGVPAHRMQHVEALGALVARDHVALGVVAHVTHVDASRWIGKHLEHVVFRPALIHDGAKGLASVPDLLPLGFGLAEVIALGFGRGGRRRHGRTPKTTEAAASASCGPSSQVFDETSGAALRYHPGRCEAGGRA